MAAAISKVGSGSLDADGRTAWSSVLAAPAYVINLDRRPERLSAALRQLRTAGFADITRFAAVDSVDRRAVMRAWDVLDLPPLGAARRPDQHLTPDQQGCFASHLLLWNHIARAAAPYAWIFEDDIRFVDGWRHLAPIYFARSRCDWDMLYVGSHAWLDLGSAWVARVPVYCLHAYLLTRAGAVNLITAIHSAPFAYPLDMMVADLEQRALDAGPSARFDWLVWHGRLHHGMSGTGSTGLVLQDRGRFPSDIAGSW